MTMVLALVAAPGDRPGKAKGSCGLAPMKAKFLADELGRVLIWVYYYSSMVRPIDQEMTATEK